MKWLLRHRLTWLVALLLVAGGLLTACAPDPTELIISPNLGEQLVAREAGNVVVRAEATPPPKLAELAPDQITAGISEELLDALAVADPAHGQQLSVANACVGCHSLDPNVQLTGPNWSDVGDMAVGRVPGQSPAAYLDTSIVDPNAFVVPGFPGGIMPQTYANTLSIQDQADLIAYLLSQTAQ